MCHITNVNEKALIQSEPTLYCWCQSNVIRHRQHIPHKRLVIPPSKCQWSAVVVWKMHLLAIWPWPLTLNPKTTTLPGHLKLIPYTNFEHFGNIRFRVKVVDIQTSKQMVPNILPMLTNRVNMWVTNQIWHPHPLLCKLYSYQKLHSNTIWMQQIYCQSQYVFLSKYEILCKITTSEHSNKLNTDKTNTHQVLWLLLKGWIS